MMPFFSLIGIEGYDKALDFDDSYKFWDSSALMCMATNLQMIFYANKQNDILVKLLLNEKETTIPLLKHTIPHYYKWSELKKYFLSRIAQ